MRSTVGLDNRNGNSVSSEAKPELPLHFLPRGQLHVFQPPSGAGWRWYSSRRRNSSSCSTRRSSTSRCPRSAPRSTSPRTTCRGSSTPTRSPSAASCCSAGGWPTCSAAAACSSPACILFAGASLAGGLAQNDVWLIAARAVQGLGAALLSPAALSLVTEIFDEGAERNKALGVWGAVAGSGGAAGVLLGGMLTEWAGWEWVLFVNVPIGIAAALMAPRLLPESRNDGARHFDIAGAVTVTAGLSLLVYSLVNANDAGWGSHETLVPARRRGRAARRLRADRAAHEGAAGAVPGHLPHAHDPRDQRHRPADRDGAVLDVLLHLALHAAGARLRRARGRPRLPAAGGAGSSSRPASRRT